MSEEQVKPLKLEPDPDMGYTVVRRKDGGMQVTFSDVDPETLMHWREFALEHLLDSDRLTRNLYDLRQLDKLPEAAINLALEANSDPSARNIRLAVVVSNETVRESIEKITAMTTFGSARIKIFTNMAEAETWLSRPLSTLV